MHISIFPTLRESHPKIVLNILAVGWDQRTHLNIFFFVFVYFVLLSVFRHLILNISRLSFNGEKKKKKKLCARNKQTKWKKKKV